MKLKGVLSASLISINALLLVFVIFSGRLVIPAWLQVFGRLHPVILHFPIVLLLLYAALLFFIPRHYKQEIWYVQLTEWLLLSAAVTASLTAIMGILLSTEPGYDADALATHKYAGVALSFFLYLLFILRPKLEKIKFLQGFSVGLACIAVIWTGHLGADITHGDNFILAPVTPEHIKERAPFEDAFVYADLVEPILETKCLGCHNSGKAKGELVMETQALLLKGGKNGKLWDTTKPDLGLLLKRIHLPEDEKEHMPPSGKPQLTDQEQEILYAWIKSGSKFDQKVTDLSPTDTLHILATKLLQSSADEKFDFAAVDEKQIQSLSNNNRVITPLAIESPALVVNFFNKAFYNSKALEELKPIAGNIIELNLDNMPVTDADLSAISQFKNLRKLNLNFTSITGSGLKNLSSLQYLRSISLSGTQVKTADITPLTSLPKLRSVYVWNTSVPESSVNELQAKNKNITYLCGYKGDTVILKLTPPVALNEEQVITSPVSLKLKSYINGTAIHYTTDGSDPDSVNSPVYNDKVQIDDDVTVKAKAFKQGWISSDVLEYHFYKTTFKADSAVFITKPDVKYSGSGASTIIDLQKSELDFGNGKWLGYRENDCNIMITFNNAVPLKNISFSMMRDINAYIFPPARIEVWGAEKGSPLKLLGSVTPAMPSKEDVDRKGISYNISFASTLVNSIKLVIRPVHSLPAWHAGKGTPAWIFMDEVFFN